MNENVMKKDKKEETVNPWFHWGGLDLQNRCKFWVFFLVKRRQARGERESESRARGGVKNKTTKKHLYPYAHQDRKTTKNILRIMNS